MTDREKIRAAFKELRKRGYTARMAFACCSTCAWSELSDEQANRAVFYNKQSDARAWRGVYDRDTLSETGIYLQWAGDAQEIITVLNGFGLRTDYDFERGTGACIQVVSNG